MNGEMCKILIVDDSTEDRAAVRRFLGRNEEFEFAFLEAERGADGVEICRAENPDCVLLDYNLPDANGLEILRQINPDPLNPVFAVILLTGSDDEKLAAGALKSGAQDYLVKDRLTAAGLGRAIKNAIEKTALQREMRRTLEDLERYRLLAEHVRDIILFFRSDGRIVEANQAALDAYGYARGEILSKSLYDIRAEETHSEIPGQIRRAEAEGGLRFECVHRRKDGSRFPVEASWSFTEIGGERVILDIIRDISERKAAEERLRESRTRLALAMDAADVYSWEIDIENGECSWSENAARALGFAPEAMPRTLAEATTFNHPEDDAEVRRTLENVLSGETRSFSFEQRLINPADRSIVWIAAQGTAENIVNGKPTRLVGLSQNITERKRVEEKIRQAAERAEIAQEAAQASFYELIPQTGEVIRSDALASVLGYAPDEIPLTGEAWRKLIHPDDVQKAWETIGTGIAGGAGFALEYRVRHKDGRYVWLYDRARLVRDAQGGSERVVGMIVDITASKEAEEKLRESEQRFRVALDHTPILVYTTDRELRYRSMFNNPSRFETFDVIGKRDDEILPLEACGELVEFKSEVLSKGTGGHREIKFPFGDRVEYWDVNAEPFRDEAGNIEGLVVAAMDITERRAAEEELRASEEFNRTVLENSPDCVKILDRDGRLQFMNANGLCLMEIDDFAPLKNKSWWELWADETKPLVKNAVEKALQGEPAQFQAFCPTAKGTPKWWDVIVSPIRGADGKPARLISVSRDTTTQKRRESNLAFLADLQAAFAPLLSEDELMRAAGSRIVEYLGLTHCLFVEIDERLKTATVVYDERRRHAPNLLGAYRLEDFHTAEERAALAAGRNIAFGDVRRDCGARAAEGFASLDIRALVTAPYLSQGVWKFALSAQTDEPREWRADERELLAELASRIYIRLERARAEQALRESENRYRATFAGAAIGISHVGLDGRWLDFNDAVCEITGYPREELLTKTFGDITHPDDLEADWAQARQLLAGEISTYSMEKRYFRKDGSIVWIRLTVSLLRDAGGAPQNFIAVIEDISALKRFEAERERLLELEQTARREAEAANRAKDEFLAMLSHELRTPLNSMYGWTQMILGGNLDAEKTRQAIEVIARSVRLQNALIEDLLDVSRIISGKMKLEPEKVSLVSIVQTAIDAARPAAEKQGVEMSSALALETDEIEGDRHRLSQIVGNLLTNAVKFTPAGGAVSVDLRRDGDRAVLTVKDTGIGIEPEVLPLIFDRFKQADASSKRKFGGLGLGLAIVKHLAELHGGAVTAHSDGAERGATFTVSLPLAAPVLTKADFIYANARDGQNARDDEPFAGTRILLVDDDPDALELLCFALESNGARAVCVNSAADALRRLDEEKFDLLISDLGMASMDGYDLIEKVRADGNGARQIPAIALTGYVSPEDRERVLRAGFQKHLAKPVDIDNLLTASLSLIKTRNNPP